MGPGQSDPHDISRWAQINVKLHFFCLQKQLCKVEIFEQTWTNKIELTDFKCDKKVKTDVKDKSSSESESESEESVDDDEAGQMPGKHKQVSHFSVKVKENQTK